MGIRSKVFIRILIGTIAITVGAGASFGEYIIEDKEAPKNTQKVVIVSSGNKKAEFRDRADRKVFEAEWDPSGKILILKGDKVYLHIYSTGKVERLTTIHDQQNEDPQQPILIQPIVPIYPRQTPGPATPGASSLTR